MGEEKQKGNNDIAEPTRLNDEPVLETFMYVSLDGRWFVHKTIITDIKPVAYMEKVLQQEEGGSDEIV